MKNMTLLPSKTFSFFMSFMTFMVKIKHFNNFRKHMAWSMEVWITINENRAKI